MKGEGEGEVKGEGEGEVKGEGREGGDHLYFPVWIIVTQFLCSDVKWLPHWVQRVLDYLQPHPQ